MSNDWMVRIETPHGKPLPLKAKITGDIRITVDLPESGASAIKRLDVPWLSQLGKDADFAPGDCGPAVNAMWLRYRGHNVTVNDVSAQSGLDRGFRYTMPAHLIHCSRHWGLDLYWRRYLKLADIKAEIDAGQPCIVLVNYPSLPVRYDQNYDSGHWLLVVGYGSGFIYYHDPYYLDNRGAFVRVTEAEFDYAWGRNHLNGNSDRQALRTLERGAG